jgi:hypothetical protein
MRSGYFIHQKKVLSLIISVMTMLFFTTTYLVLNSPPSSLDVSFTIAVQRYHSHTLDTCANFISWFGYMPVSLIMVLVVATLFLLSGFKRPALFTLYTLISGLFSAGIKLLINRPRPTKNLVRIIDAVKDEWSCFVLHLVLWNVNPDNGAGEKDSNGFKRDGFHYFCVIDHYGSFIENLFRRTLVHRCSWWFDFGFNVAINSWLFLF